VLGDDLLTGAVDLHVHGAPDVVPRQHTDLELARRAAAAGMAAIVLKSHSESTVGRAALVREATGFATWGGLVLNAAVTGGIDPDAVQLSLELGARVIWMPTVSSADHLRAFPGAAPGTNRAARRPVRIGRSALRAVCEHVARHDAVLATGHLGAAQCAAVAEAATTAGARVLMQHPDYTVPSLSIRTQVALAERFPTVVFERCAFVVSRGAPRPTTAAHVLAAARAVGIERNVISSDLGQPENGPYPDGLAAFVRELLAVGLTHDEARTLLVEMPGRVLGEG
jgi:hypothetical protein